MTARILVVDNDPGMVQMLSDHLVREGWQVTVATGGHAALSLLERSEFDVVLTDLVMADVDGLVLLRAAQAAASRPRVLLMTAFGSLDSAIEAIRYGASDYLRQPFRLDEVTVALRRALEYRDLREENTRPRICVEQHYDFGGLVGTSRAMQVVIDEVRAVADSEATVLLLGESGTGKELVARAVHWNSSRRDGPFVPVNCAAVPESLLESELFGRVKGAFTGADRPRRGLFADATTGTLFLECVSEGTFREDLYYRLSVIPIRLPSLRERPEDIPVLARHFLARLAAQRKCRAEGFTEEADRVLAEHRWPGNVRELQNAVERATTLARGSLIDAADLVLDAGAGGPAGGQLRPTVTLTRRYAGQVLAETNGDKQRAARVLGVSVRTVQRWFKAA